MIPAIEPGIGLKEDRPAPRILPRENPAFSQALKHAAERPQTPRQRTGEEPRATSDPQSRAEYGQPSDDAVQTAGAGPEQGPTQAAREPAAKDSAKAEDGTGAKAPAKAEDGTGAKAPAKAKTGKAKSDATDATAAATAAAAAAGATGAPTGQAELLAAAQQAGNPHLQPTPAAALTIGEVVQNSALAARALQPATATAAGLAADGTPLQATATDGKFQGAGDSTPIAAQIGAAAYRMGVHGKGEASLAEANGTALPGAVQAQLLGEGVHDVRMATLQAAAKDDLTRSVDDAPTNPRELLHPSDAAKAKQGDGLSYKEQIALQTAQTRNEVLARLAGTGAAAGAAPGADPGAAAALRQQLQLQGLLARDARAHTLEPSAAQVSTPPSTAQVTAAGALLPANSVNLTTLRETHRDEAVAQRLVERVTNEARWMISSNRQEVTFRLSPEHLGNLHMKVLHKDGVFDVQMTVDNLAAKHLLESNLQELRNRMAADHPGGEFQFNVDVRQGNDQPSLYSRAARPVPAAIGRVAGLEQATAPALAGRVMNHSGLSIYV